MRPIIFLIRNIKRKMAQPLPRSMEAVYRCAGAVHYVAMVLTRRGPAGSELLYLEPGDPEDGVGHVAEEEEGAPIRDAACAGGYIGPGSSEKFVVI